MVELDWKPYAEVSSRWPQTGRHILASFSQDDVIVYQAYRPEIAAVAVAQQRFGPPFSLERMSWIKPNFLWMMHRCGWATKPDQQCVLAIHLPRRRFDEILRQAVWSSFQPGLHPTIESWKTSVDHSDVRLQWDPDHGPSGKPQARRAIQLGLRGRVLEQFASQWPVRIDNITPMVHTQHQRLTASSDVLVPDERPLPISDTAIRHQLQVDQP